MRHHRTLAVLAAALLTACGGSGTGQAQDPAPPTAAPPISASPEVPAPVSPAAAPSPAMGALAIPVASLEAPEVVAARAWLEASSAGDTATQWTLLGPVSKDEVGSPEALERLTTDFSEGWGAWTSSTDAVVFRSGVIAASREGRRSVVAVTGTVAQEGMTERRTVTLPATAVRDSDDPADGRVEPFAMSAAELTIDSLGESQVTGCVRDVAGTLAGEVDPATAVASVDGADGFRPAFDPALPAPRFAFPLDEPLGAGEHVLVLAALDGQGDVAADAVRFTIEGTC